MTIELYETTSSLASDRNLKDVVYLIYCDDLSNTVLSRQYFVTSQVLSTFKSYN